MALTVRVDKLRDMLFDVDRSDHSKFDSKKKKN